MIDPIELIGIFANNIVPIFLIAGVGYLAGTRLDVPPKPIATLVFYILSPALVFWALYTSEVSGDEIVLLVIAMSVFQVIMLLLSMGVLNFQGADSVARANVMLSAFCLNAGNYGLALVSFAFPPEVFSRAVVAFIANVTLNYSLGVFVASNGRGSARDALISVIKTPSVYAVLAAFAIRAFDIELPLALARASETLAGATIPSMLMLLGIQLSRFTRLDRLNLVATGVSLKLLVAPFIALGLALLLNLNPEARAGFIMQASMPTAVLTIILATEFDLDTDLALNLIITSTLFSPITLSILIALLT